MAAKTSQIWFHHMRETNVLAARQGLFLVFLSRQANKCVLWNVFTLSAPSQSTDYKPRQVAACRPKCTVSRQTAHLAALIFRPTVKRWGMLWCILSFTRRPNSVVQIETKKWAKAIVKKKKLVNTLVDEITSEVSHKSIRSMFKQHLRKAWIILRSNYKAMHESTFLSVKIRLCMTLTME